MIRLSRFPSVPALALAACTTSAWAIEPQYRSVELADGRKFKAEILSTEPQGLLMQLPQGKALISFELLVDMSPVTQAAYDQQPPWVVYYDVPDAIGTQVTELLNAMNIEPIPVGTVIEGIRPEAAGRASSTTCKANVGCIADAVGDASRWLWVLSAQSADGGLSFQAKINTPAASTAKLLVEGKDRQDIWEGLHAVLGLKVERKAPQSTRTDEPSAKKPLTKRQINALSFVPVPGLPSLAQRDGGGFGAALGIVVPSTVLWVGTVGSSAQNTAEAAGFAVGGYYLVTVFTNQIMGMSSRKRAVGQLGAAVVPTPHGGASVVFSSQPRRGK